MRVLFGTQDVLDLVTDGYVPVVADASAGHRNMQRDIRKKDHKKLFYIHQCVYANAFEKVAHSMIMKAAWDILTRCYDSDASVKKVKL